MKRIKQIGLLCLLIIVSMVSIACRTTSPEDDDMARVEQILEQLREVDSSAALYSTSNYYQIVYSNDAGDEINFYNNIKTEYYGEIREIDGIHTDAISTVINPILAENSRELEIQDKEAVIYTYDGREYLCWTISPEDSCVIEYEPGKFDENEIIKMAESVKSSKED